MQRRFVTSHRPDAYAHTHAIAVAFSEPVADAEAITNTDSFADTYTVADAEAVANTDSLANTHTVADAETFTNADAVANSYAHAHANTNADPDTNAVSAHGFGFVDGQHQHWTCRLQRLSRRHKRWTVYAHLARAGAECGELRR